MLGCVHYAFTFLLQRSNSDETRKPKQSPATTACGLHHTGTLN